MEFIVGLECVAKVTHRHFESNETETQTKKKPRLPRSNSCYHFLLGHLVAQFARSHPPPPAYGTRKAARALDIKAHDRGNGYGAHVEIDTENKYGATSKAYGRKIDWQRPLM